MQYKTIAAGQSDVAVGTAGNTSPGDNLIRLVAVVTTAATSQVTLKDGGGSAIEIVPNNVGGGVGVYPVSLEMVSRVGQFTFSTGAGVALIVIGVFK